MHARVLKKGKVDVYSTWLYCSQLEDESHLLFRPVDVIASAKLDTTDLGIRYGVLQSIEMLCNGETGRFFLYTSEMFLEAFSECVKFLLLKCDMLQWPYFHPISGLAC